MGLCGNRKTKISHCVENPINNKQNNNNIRKFRKLKKVAKKKRDEIRKDTFHFYDQKVSRKNQMEIRHLKP